jgi:hypothetical protein
MSSSGSWEAFRRRSEREALKRERALEKQAKEQAKLSAIEQARLEVETFDNHIEILLSIHKDCAEPWDWLAIATKLPPPPVLKSARYELRARQAMTIVSASEQRGWEEKLEIARLQDEHAYKAARIEYNLNYLHWERLTTLANKIRAGDPIGYEAAINEFSPLTEISHFGSSTEFLVHNPRLMECSLVLNSNTAIPAETKSLTASNKVSVKPMPKARLHELYQDYLCSCMLRVARELFALLPIEILLLTARTTIFDPGTGNNVEEPVLSVAIPRAGLRNLNFDGLDPSDTIETFQHRGDFKASRKSGAFAPINPLMPNDIMSSSVESLGLSELQKEATSVRQAIAATLTGMRGQLASSTP